MTITTTPPAQSELNPACAYGKPIDLGTYGGAAFSNPDVIRSVNGVLSATLTVAYLNTTIAGCPVHLRTYNHKLVGPTLRVKPGDRLSIDLKNDLPLNPGHSHQDMNTPHDFNTTNLHTHGLHTDPTGKPDAWGDNVLLRVEPHKVEHYEITLPANHPTGTYWYHAHSHGSTAIQVSSGMGGALIVEGGLDTVPEIAAAQENIFLLQQLVYSSTGQLESYDDFGPCTWEASQREHTINGQLFPTITVAPGAVQRWRFIHAGVRETVSLELRGPGPETITQVTPTLDLPRNQLHEIAVDGMALGKIDTWQRIDLNPGYRSDVMFQAPMSPGTYYLIDGPGQGESLTCPGNPEQPSLLAKLVVTGNPAAMNLPTEAEVVNLAPFKDDPLVTMDLSQTPGSAEFLVPTKPISGFQEMSFTVTGYPQPLGNNSVFEFMAGERPYSGDHVRKLQLNHTEMWVLSTKDDSLYYAHPFHIHVNPFQTWRMGPEGVPELIWRDTLMVPKGSPQYIYTNYTDFTGAFVYHCHILDHEDQGMMEQVEIVK